MRQKLLNQAAGAIRTASSVLIACHVRPDGDALGSLLGLGLGLERLGKRVLMVSPDGVPELYRFLPHHERVVTAAAGAFDLAIGVDADGSRRLGSAEAAGLAAPFVIDVDHHSGQEPYGNLHLVDPRRSATGELVLAVLDELGVRLERDLAVCLMTALLTDTGSFRYPNVTPETLRIAARLVEAGALPGPIYEAVYEQKPLAAVRLAGLALERAETGRGGELVWSALARADFADAGATDEETEGIISELRAVRGARVAILIREESDGQIRASLRSRDGTNVARIAQQFDGGGHPGAAGCSLPGPLADASRRLVQAALAALAETS